jgi:hypothetical protein
VSDEPEASCLPSGVRKTIFHEMLEIARIADAKQMVKGGRPSHLRIEDKLLMSLEYLREYRTYFHLGQSYGVSESTCYKNCKWIEDTLIKDKKFVLPGKKVLLKSDAPIEVVLIDATETPIERPKKKNTMQKADSKSKQQTETLLFRKKKTTHNQNSSCSRKTNEQSSVYKLL